MHTSLFKRIYPERLRLIDQAHATDLISFDEHRIDIKINKEEVTCHSR